MLTIFKKTTSYLLDLVFPKECIGCGKEGEFLCKKCKKEIILIKAFHCPKCKKLNGSGAFCPNCRRKFSLNGIIIAAHYRYGPLRKAVHFFKYNGIVELENYFSQIIIKRLKENLPRGKKIVIPIPLHRHKELRRGYNQAERLAKIIAQSLNLPLIDALKRQKDTDSQTKLKKKERKINIDEAFFCNKISKIKNKTILLVDDITTTGLTLDEAAKTLKINGAKSVWGIVIAQG